jgi:hypothetical protein
MNIVGGNDWAAMPRLEMSGSTERKSPRSRRRATGVFPIRLEAAGWALMVAATSACVAPSARMLDFHEER